ncbi:MAG: zinc-ribbon and DUF3426 domain-containing protein [Burkholderiales bacterium]|nr:zinc-ribbon and DUF3426 domain-containing protein [Burkholderiales bacterium]
MAGGLATRCPACDTAFRVVLDQLRVSDGWVRCGRCTEVFNAGERLIDVETGAPRRMPEPVAESGPGPAAEPAAAPGGVDIEFESAAFADAADAADAVPRTAAGPAATGPAARADIALWASEPPGPAGPDEAGARIDADAEADLRAEPAAMPSFLRRAEQAQRWQQPRVRAGLAAVAVLGLLGLAGQVGYSYRDLVAARYPALAPVLAQACAALGCTIAPPRLIESLSVDSSGLVRVDNSNRYRLSVALRNRAGVEAALPALELALTDSQGRLLARRVLRPGELGAGQAALPAGREVTLQATLQAATDPVAGYTIELFYP